MKKHCSVLIISALLCVTRMYPTLSKYSTACQVTLTWE